MILLYFDRTLRKISEGGRRKPVWVPLQSGLSSKFFRWFLLTAQWWNTILMRGKILQYFLASSKIGSRRSL